MGEEDDSDDYRELLPEGTPEQLTIPVTFDMMKAARLLRRCLPHEQYGRLFESIVQLESDDLEVDSSLVELPPEQQRIEAERQPSLFSETERLEE